MWPEIPLIQDAIKKLNSYKIELEKAQTKLRKKMFDVIATSQVYKSDVNKKINLLRLMDQVLYINIRFLKTFGDVFALDEPALFATISRGIFELHLILLEATSSDEKFVKIQFKIGNSYRLFVEKALGLALRSKNIEGIKTFRKELKRIGQLTRERSKLWKVDLKTLETYSKFFDFEEIAKRNRLLEDYRFDYGLLSSYLHPTDLYILTTPPIPGTMDPEKQKLAEWNVRNRNILIKNECVRVALIYSQRNQDRILELVDRLC
jgi:hypothetical protein